MTDTIVRIGRFSALRAHTSCCRALLARGRGCDVGRSCRRISTVNDGETSKHGSNAVAIDQSIECPKVVSAPKVTMKALGQLGKARLSGLVVASASCGFLLAGAPVDIVGLSAVTAGVAMQSFAANSLNQIYEVKTDALMNRTRARPLPSGRITQSQALVFAASNAVAGTALLAAFCTPVSAALGAANIFLYAGVYTPMKQWTTYNTHVGALVGALPPLIGYSAATGTLSVEAGILGAALYLWQLPHFYALAYMYKTDYLAGNHKMMPCFDPTGARTAASLIKNTALLSSLPLACYSLGITGAMFPLESIAFNGYLMYVAYGFKSDPSIKNARKVFRASLFYLPVFLGLMIFHKNGWSQDDEVVTHQPNALFQQHTTSFQPTGQENAFERALLDAKHAMRSICLHEYLTSPPLTRLQQSLEVAQSGSACPITQASMLVSRASRRAD